MWSENTPFEMVGPLPQQAPQVQRVRVRNHRIERDVEYRILSAAADPVTEAAFLAEVRDLLRLDHPYFLPVLDRGKVRGCHSYTVPFRVHPTVAEAARAGGLTRAESMDLVRGTATALAAAHDAGIPQRGFDPRWILWDRATAVITISYRTLSAPRYIERADLRLPDDVRDRSGQFNPRTDIFHWGVFAYYCLTGGNYPYAADCPILTPIREFAPEVPETLATVLEATLERTPADRPTSGPELVRVLRTTEFRRTPPTPSEKQAPSQFFRRAAEEAISAKSVTGLGEIAADTPPAPEPPAAPESEEMQEFLEEIQASMVHSLDSLPEPTSPPEPAPQDASTGSSARTWAKVGLALGFGFLLQNLAASRSPSTEAQPFTPPPSALPLPATPEALRPPPPLSVVPLSPGDAASYLRDPDVMTLIEPRVLTASDLASASRLVRDLTLAGRLPPRVASTEAVAELVRLCRHQPELGVPALERFIEDLRNVLDLDPGASF